MDGPDVIPSSQPPPQSRVTRKRASTTSETESSTNAKRQLTSAKEINLKAGQAPTRTGQKATSSGAKAGVSQKPSVLSGKKVGRPKKLKHPAAIALTTAKASPVTLPTPSLIRSRASIVAYPSAVWTAASSAAINTSGPPQQARPSSGQPPAAMSNSASMPGGDNHATSTGTPAAATSANPTTAAAAGADAASLSRPPSQDQVMASGASSGATGNRPLLRPQQRPQPVRAFTLPPPSSSSSSSEEEELDHKEGLTAGLLVSLFGKQSKRLKKGRKKDKKSRRAMEQRITDNINQSVSSYDEEIKDLRRQAADDKQEIINHCDNAIKVAIETAMAELRPAVGADGEADNSQGDNQIAVQYVQRQGPAPRRDADFFRCRRTVLITGIKHTPNETSEYLKEAVEKFCLDVLKVDDEKWANFGKFSVTRPATKYSKDKSPVEMVCARVASRDLVMSCMGPLSRATPKWSLGSLQAKYPEAWQEKVRNLSKQAGEIRKITAKNIADEDTQAFYTKVR